MGQVDFNQIAENIQSNSKTNGKGKYKQYSNKDRFIIEKCASENRPAAAVRKFKKDFANINKSTVRGFRKRNEKEIAQAAKDQRSTATILPTQKRGPPLMLGKFDDLVKRYISADSNRGSVITRSVVASTARALLYRYPNVVGEIAIEDTFWAKSLLRRMGMVRRMKTTSKLPIPEGAIREAGLIFHHDIVSKVKRHKIPDVLILNLDQTPSKYVTVVQTTLAKKTSKFAAIAGRSDKRSITATFAVTFDGTFLPMQ